MGDTPKLAVKMSKATPVSLFSSLLNSVTQVHIFHLQTNSYAAHVALGDYYDKVGELADTLIETYQGKYGIVKGYTTLNLTDISDPCGYLDALHQKVEGSRSLFTDSDLLNILDEVKTLLKSTIYKLENLK